MGAGDISAVHAAAASAVGAEVVAVADHDPARAAARAEPLGAATFTSVEEVLAGADVDVVHVCTPHDEHAEIATIALAAGVHVLVEKPLAHTLEPALRLAAAAREARGKLGVCFQNRYNDTSVAMHDALRRGVVGTVQAATASVVWSRPLAYYANKRWAGQRERAGGGALINQAIHTLDLLGWLVGPITQVHGRATRLVPIDGVDVDDTADLVLTHDGPAGEVRSTMFASTAHARNEPVTLEIVGDRGSLSLRGDLLINADGETTRVSDAVAEGGVPSYWGRSHERLIGDFYSRLDRPEPFWLDAEVGLANQRVVEAVYQG